jgi:hypothetical protein
MKSLASKGMATEVYNWGYFYYAITDKGVTYIKEQFGYNDERVKPQTYLYKSETKTSTNVRNEQGGRPFRGTGTRGGKGREETTGGPNVDAPAQTSEQ